MFDAVLVANRGEIALRVMRTCRELGVRCCAVYSEIDRTAPHVRAADAALCIGGAPASESYLDGGKVIAAALELGAQAIHPGYGFLSENAGFAQAVADAGLVFIGPPPQAITSMGDKVRAREIMEAAGVPVVPGTSKALRDGEVAGVARDIGFPVMLKAAAGGGGKGMRLVEDPSGLQGALDAARSEALSAFGDDTVYLEKFVTDPHHVEIQVFAGADGEVWHLFERDCSVQRRHQKVIEETPCPFLPDDVRAAMCAAATRATEAACYQGAGTVEFLVDGDNRFYFLEMNTRLQVEHPITEWVTGLDLVALQLRAAAGEPTGLSQAEITTRGAAIEARIYAEDPDRGFLPSPGLIDQLRLPGGPFVRVDEGVSADSEVSIHYDPMIAKVSVWGPDRPTAIARLDRALAGFVVGGITTNIRYLRRCLAHPAFASGRYDTGFALQLGEDAGPGDTAAVALIAAAVATYEQERELAREARPAGSGRSLWQQAGLLQGLARRRT